MAIISSNIKEAVRILNQNELVAIPTETVYGLAANIYSEEAVAKIFEMKQRPLFNPLIVHIHSLSQLIELTSYVPEKATILAEAFWPGPLTLVLKKNPSVPNIITADKDTVALRMPSHPVTLALLEQLSFPLAAPSANPFGCISPTSSQHVESYFGEELEMILEGGHCERGIESTIIGFDGDLPILYRLGAIALDEIEKIIGIVTVKNKNNSSPDAPGMLLRHYAPATTTVLSNNIIASIQEFSTAKIGLLLFSKIVECDSNIHQEILSQKGDFKEAASKLYAALHKLDKLGLDIIIAERLPDIGLGKSINDRLERATEK